MFILNRDSHAKADVVLVGETDEKSPEQLVRDADPMESTVRQLPVRERAATFAVDETSLRLAPVYVAAVEAEENARDDSLGFGDAPGVVGGLAPLTTFWGEVRAASGDKAAMVSVDGESDPDGEPESTSVKATKSQYFLLGQHFVDTGAITEEQLSDALSEQENTFEKIGAILVRLGFVTSAQVEDAVRAQKDVRNLESVLKMLGLKVNHIRSVMTRVERRNEKIQMVMRDTRYLSEEKVALALAAQSGLQHFSDDRVNRCRFADLIERGADLPKYDGFVPVAILDDKTIAIAIEDLDRRNDAHNHFEEWPNKIYLLASSRTLQKVFCTYFSRTEQELNQALLRAEELISSKQEGSGENDGFMRSLVGLILRHGCYSGASDIHFLQSRQIGTLSMRYDGVLRDVAYFDRQLHERIANMLVMDGLQGAADSGGGAHVMREGAVTFARDEKAKIEFADVLERYRFRLELGTTANGSESAVIRIMDPQGDTADLDHMGFDSQSRAIVDEAILAPDGLILLVGPTGSGKTTTLYACMNEIDPEELSIQAIENPVEGEHGKWKSYQPLKRAGMTEGAEMGAIFKGAMRNDPDVILVGEIRDAEVADLAMQAAKTGHLVFSTLHVDRAAATVTRLTGLKVDRQDVADSLKLVIAQRLLRRLCRACAIEDTRKSTQKLFEKPLAGYLKDIGQPRFLRARDGGCENCRHTGYRGRIMVYEIVRMTMRLREMIESGASTTAIEKEAITPGRSMWDTGMRYVANGSSSVEELRRTVLAPMEGS
jgi:type II secretory ATPase GspE/PulE/Tfp pilus assembly ATPase PilB-like protein